VNIFIISLLLILFSSNVLNLLILLPLTSKYVSWSLNLGKSLLSFSSNLTNKSTFLHGKQKWSISWIFLHTNLIANIFSPGLIDIIEFSNLDWYIRISSFFSWISFSNNAILFSLFWIFLIWLFKLFIWLFKSFIILFNLAFSLIRSWFLFLSSFNCLFKLLIWNS